MQIAESTSANRKSFSRRVSHHLRIDMTPMVDLGFLLISFFIITTQLSRPNALQLYMPADGPPSVLGESNAITVILGDKQSWYYEGKWSNALHEHKIIGIKSINPIELRQLIMRKQSLADRENMKEGRAGIMVLIKPTASCSYTSLVNVLDEMTITDIKKYAVVKLSEEENRWASAQESN